MPELEMQDRLASELKEGWTLFDEKITEVKVGRKNVYVRLEKPVAGKSLYPFTVSDHVTAGVWVPTADEKLAKAKEQEQFARDVFVEQLQKHTEAAVGMTERARDEIKPEWVRYYDVDALLIADAQERIWKRIADLVEAGARQKLHIAHTDGGECEYTERTERGGRRCVKPTVPTTAYDGAVRAIEWLTDELQAKASEFRATSRSTSKMSNYMDDVYLEQLGKVIGQLRWSMPSEVRALLPKGW